MAVVVVPPVVVDSEYTEAPEVASTVALGVADDVAEVVVGKPVTGSVKTCPSVKTALDSAIDPVEAAEDESPPPNT